MLKSLQLLVYPFLETKVIPYNVFPSSLGLAFCKGQVIWSSGPLLMSSQPSDWKVWLKPQNLKKNIS